MGHLGGDFAAGPGVDTTEIHRTQISLDSSPEGDMIRDVVFTPDGSRYLIAHRDSENVLIYQAATGNLLAEIPVEGKPVDLDVTPNGAYAVSANTDGNTVTVIDLATLTKVADIATSSAWPYRVHTTGDSSRAVVATAGGEYVTVSLTTFAQTHQFEASGLGSLQFIDLTDGSRASVQAGNTSGFAISSDGNYVLAGDVVDLASKTRVKTLPYDSSMDFVVTSPTESRGLKISRLQNDQ